MITGSTVSVRLGPATGPIRMEINRILENAQRGTDVMRLLSAYTLLVPPSRGYIYIYELENIDFGDTDVDVERFFQRALYLSGFFNTILFVRTNKPMRIRFYDSGMIDTRKGYGPVYQLLLSEELSNLFQC